MKSKLFAKLGLRLAQRVMASRAYDQLIGPVDDPYMLRWRLFRKGWWPNIYIHLFLRSDDARALHDHPTDNISLICDGVYAEVFADGSVFRDPGDIVCRFATTPHRVELIELLDGPKQVITLFFCGPRRRDWGFHCPNGWVHWQKFTTPDGNQIGKGCDQ
jgi:hypothetical protein